MFTSKIGILQILKSHWNVITSRNLQSALMTEKDCLYNLYKTALTDLIEHTSIYANDQ